MKQRRGPPSRRRSAQAASGRRTPASQLRLVGGRWRGRKLTFDPLDGLRPTPDRVRETLFNWLAPAVQGARCLDLFAGSGALGIEALSRGAASVLFVERDRRAVADLRNNLATLRRDGGGEARVICADAPGWLQRAVDAGSVRTDPAGAADGPDEVFGGFDIVFLDPPFGQGLLAPCCAALAAGLLPSATALIYLESETGLALCLPDGWSVLKDKTAGQVRYRLAAAGGLRTSGGTGGANKAAKP